MTGSQLIASWPQDLASSCIVDIFHTVLVGPACYRMASMIMCPKPTRLYSRSRLGAGTGYQPWQDGKSWWLHVLTAIKKYKSPTGCTNSMLNLVKIRISIQKRSCLLHICKLDGTKAVRCNHQGCMNKTYVSRRKQRLHRQTKQSICCKMYAAVR